MKPSLRRLFKFPVRRGITLVIALIMLVMLTAMALTAFHLGTSHTAIVSNAQHRGEAEAAAQQAIDTVLNSSNFMMSPAAAIPVGNCPGGGANAICVDVDGDADAELTVALNPQPACIGGAPINASALDFSRPEDLACAVAIQQSFGVEGSAMGESLCAVSNWEVAAVATDAATHANVRIVQGVSARIARTDLLNNCP